MKQIVITVVIVVATLIFGSLTERSYATSIAFGDVDGDGLDEIGTIGNSWWILDDGHNDYEILGSGSDEWGASSIAFGDVDGDGLDEIGIIGEKSSTNECWWILDDANQNFAILGSGGEEWRGRYYFYDATSIAFGDVDGDGCDEVGLTRRGYLSKTRRYTSYWIFDDANQNFAILGSGGKKWWGRYYYATSIAFGDVDGDGLMEVGITRSSNAGWGMAGWRFIIMDDANQNFAYLRSGGEKWGRYDNATSIAFGDVDGDGRDEVGLTRRYGYGWPPKPSARKHTSYWIFDDANQNFSKLRIGGKKWGRYDDATSIAFSDVDGDGRDEVGLTRRYAHPNARTNARKRTSYWIFDDANQNFAYLRSGGWGRHIYSKSIVFGDVDGDGLMEVGITRRNVDKDWRFIIIDDVNHNFGELKKGNEEWW